MKTVNLIYPVKLLLLLLISVLILCSSIQILAAGNVIVGVAAPAQPIPTGSQFTVDINVQPNNAIAGAQFNLSFSPSLVTVNSITEGNLLKQNGANTYFIPGQINNTNGTVSGVAGVIISPGQTVSSPGTLATITMTAGSNSGTSLITLSNVIAGDVNGQSIPITINNGQVTVHINHTPVLTSIGSKSINEGALLSFAISATDPDGDTLAYSGSNLPSGASFNNSTHTFSWTPNFAQAGTYLGVHFSVSDGSLSASEDIIITVSNVNRAPILTSIGNRSVNEGALLTFTISATDPDGDTLTYSASNLLSGASFNASTRTFSWTPTFSQAGTYPGVRFSVSDGSLSASGDITITVIQPFAAWDTSQDGAVNVLDMLLVSQHWGESGVICWIKEDVNSDGSISVLDDILVGQHWTG